MPAAKMKPFVPRIVELPARTMAVAHTAGNPNEVGPTVFPALYGAVYGLKFARKKDGRDFRIEPPRARWFFPAAEWSATPPEIWSAAWAIPVPDDTSELIQKNPAMPVTVERWDYGTVAEILHVGAYADEAPTIAALTSYIADQG